MHYDHAWVMSVEEVLEKIGISRRTLERRIALGQVPGAVKLGGRRLFIRSKLEQWVQDGFKAPSKSKKGGRS